MSVYIAGMCSVPNCPLEPPKDQNAFCQDHWTRLPGRLRRRLTKVWRSRTGGHHGKVVKGHDWPKAVAAGVRYFGVLPRNELPRGEVEPEALRLSDQARAILQAELDVPALADDSRAALSQIQQERKEPMATATAPQVDQDGYVHIGKRRYSPEGYTRLMAALRRGTATRKAKGAATKAANNGDSQPAKTRRYSRPHYKLMFNGKPNGVVHEAYREWMLSRYEQGLPFPKEPLEIFVAGMMAEAGRR